MTVTVVTSGGAGRPEALSLAAGATVGTALDSCSIELGSRYNVSVRRGVHTFGYSEVTESFPLQDGDLISVHPKHIAGA